MSILDFIEAKPAPNVFRPATTRDLYALRLAQKLGEPTVAAHYARLVAEHSEEALRSAYRWAANGGTMPPDVARRFHTGLSLGTGRASQQSAERLMAIKVERRSVAVAVFVGLKLDYHDVRHLSSIPEKAEASAMGFLNWVMENCDIESVTLERMTDGNEIRRGVLNAAIIRMLRAATMPVWEVSKRDLLAAYGHPPLRSRKELREISQAILWAMLNTDKPDWQELDAAAIGLYVQTERLFLY